MLKPEIPDEEALVTVIRRETVIEKDGEVHLHDIPCRKGDRIEAIVVLPEHAPENTRAEARSRLMARARASRLHSSGTYPWRFSCR